MSRWKKIHNEHSDNVNGHLENLDKWAFEQILNNLLIWKFDPKNMEDETNQFHQIEHSNTISVWGPELSTYPRISEIFWEFV